MFTHFYSDPHLGHKNIIKYANRPFESVYEMNETLIANYNNIICKDDFCLWFGDTVFMGKEDARIMLARFNGKKALIKGNHDKHSPNWFLSLGFSYIFDTPIHLSIGGYPVRASHYPYITTLKGVPRNKYVDRYPAPKKGEILLHGHIHNKIKINGNQIHVGVDAWDYSPISIKQIQELIFQKFVKGRYA